MSRQPSNIQSNADPTPKSNKSQPDENNSSPTLELIPESIMVKIEYISYKDNRYKIHNMFQGHSQEHTKRNYTYHIRHILRYSFFQEFTHINCISHQLHKKKLSKAIPVVKLYIITS